MLARTYQTATMGHVYFLSFFTFQLYHISEKKKAIVTKGNKKKMPNTYQIVWIISTDSPGTTVVVPVFPAMVVVTLI